MSVENRTVKEQLAQRAKRDRRYASSVGRGYCQLTRKRLMCNGVSVRNIEGIWICQHHSDLLDAIKHDARDRRYKPSSRPTNPRRAVR